MHKIAFFSTKGGTGRTTCAMALACGLRAQGKSVMVVDCTGSFGTSPLSGLQSTLLRWYDHMPNCDIDDRRLMLAHCDTPDHVAGVLAMTEEFRVDVILFDMSSYPNAAQYAVLEHADLVITPAMGPNEAQFGSEGIYNHYDYHERVIGLVSGAAGSPDRAAQTRAAFQTDHVFRTELPYAQAFEYLKDDGDLGKLVAQRTCQFDDPDFAYFKGAKAAWRAVGHLTFEVLSALDGYYLKQQKPSRMGLRAVG